MSENFMDQIEEKLKKAEAFDNFKANRQKILEKFSEMRKWLDEVERIVDPTAALPKTRQSRKPLKDIASELYNIMEKGTQVTMEFIEKTYTDLDKGNAYYLMNMLVKMPNVEKAKDGTKVRLYIFQPGNSA